MGWKNHELVQERHEMIIALEREGMLHKQIARRVGLDRTTVSQHIHAHYKEPYSHRDGRARVLCRCKGGLT